MKNVILILAVCITLNSPAQKNVSFGLKGGLNIASIKAGGLEYADYRYRTSFHAGCLAHIRLNEKFALQPELLYSGQGAKYQTTYQSDDVPDVAYKLHLNYLNVPLIVQYLFGNGFRLETGPQVGFLVSAKSKDNYSEQDIKGHLKDIDFSWDFGAGYSTGLGFGLDVRYNLGLSDIDESTEDAESNRVFQIGVFYVFGREKK